MQRGNTKIPACFACFHLRWLFEEADSTFSAFIGEPGFSRAKNRLDAAMARHAGGENAPFILHDVRRSAVTHMARLGIAPHVVDRILNHTSGTIRGVARVYNRFDYVDERRVALDRWGAHVEALVEGRSATNVAQFTLPDSGSILVRSARHLTKTSRLLARDQRVRQAKAIIEKHGEAEARTGASVVERTESMLDWTEFMSKGDRALRYVGSKKDRLADARVLAWLRRGVALLRGLEMWPKGFENFRSEVERWANAYESGQERRPTRVPKRRAYDKKFAAEAAVHLCDEFGIRPTATGPDPIANWLQSSTAIRRPIYKSTANEWLAPTTAPRWPDRCQTGMRIFPVHHHKS